MPCAGPYIGSAATGMPKIAIIAAMKQEIAHLLHDSALAWKVHTPSIAFGAWQSERAALVIAGIGAN